MDQRFGLIPGTTSEVAPHARPMNAGASFGGLAAELGEAAVDGVVADDVLGARCLTVAHARSDVPVLCLDWTFRLVPQDFVVQDQCPSAMRDLAEIPDAELPEHPDYQFGPLIVVESYEGRRTHEDLQPAVPPPVGVGVVDRLCGPRGEVGSRAGVRQFELQAESGLGSFQSDASRGRRTASIRRLRPEQCTPRTSRWMLNHWPSSPSAHSANSASLASQGWSRGSLGRSKIIFLLR